MNLTSPSRRDFLAAAATTAGLAHSSDAAQPDDKNLANRALIAITLDLEMSRNFPGWNDTEWDFEKGNLNEPTKRYTVEACRRVRAHGGVIHCFAVGRVFEQANVDWLRGIVKAGHPVGNHTYDHVNVLATRPEDVQFRFRRCPWLIEGRKPAEVIRDNIRLCTAAMRSRLEVSPAGFRTPGGFSDGLRDRPDVQQMLRDLGYAWVSSLYPAHRMSTAGKEPGPDVFKSIVAAQAAAQPFIYNRGLIEIPMSPVSDIGAFRGGRWHLKWFLRAVREAVEWAIDNRRVFDFLAHPSCLYVTDPEFRTIELICELVRKAGNRAALVDLNTIAGRVKRP
ncbi:MAG: chitin deacetylase [Planctomycetes bacterium]|nr:chitin deacetylase [Planctomycetota bacterium]